MFVGFLTVHLVSGLLVEQVNEGSLLWVALHWFGLLFLALIALRLLTLKPASIRQAMDDDGFESLIRLQDGTVPRFGFRTGVMMQFVNGKEWALVITIMRQALDGFGGGLTGMLLIASLTCTGGVAAMSLWSVGGGRLTGVLRDDVRGRRVLVGLGVLVLLLLAALRCAADQAWVLLNPEGHEVVLGALQMFGHRGLSSATSPPVLPRAPPWGVVVAHLLCGFEDLLPAWGKARSNAAAPGSDCEMRSLRLPGTSESISLR